MPDVEAAQIELENTVLEADLALPAPGGGIVVFAHGSGSSRHSPRNRLVAETLQRAGLGTVLVDLLTAAEDERDLLTGELRFDISLLTSRTTGIVDWLRAQARTADTPIGLFGASTGAAAAISTAAQRPDAVAAVVSRGGRIDLAAAALVGLRAPILLIVGEDDSPIVEQHRRLQPQLTAQNRLDVVPGATHLFEEAGAIEQVAEAAGSWFVRHLAKRVGDGPAQG